MFNLGGKVFVEIDQQESTKSLLIRNMKTLTQCDRFIDPCTGIVAACRSLVTPVMEHVKRHIETIEEEHWLKQMIQQQFLRTTGC